MADAPRRTIRAQATSPVAVAIEKSTTPGPSHSPSLFQKTTPHAGQAIFMLKRESKIGPSPHLGHRSAIARPISFQPEIRSGSPVPPVRRGLLSHAIPMIKYAPISESRTITPRAPRIAKATSPLGVIQFHLLTFTLESARNSHRMRRKLAFSAVSSNNDLIVGSTLASCDGDKVAAACRLQHEQQLCPESGKPNRGYAFLHGQRTNVINPETALSGR